MRSITPPTSQPPAPAASRRPARRRRALLAVGLGAPVVLYAIWIGAMVGFQERVIFPRAYFPEKGRSDATDPRIERVWLAIPDSPDPAAKVEAWFQPGRGRSAESPGPAVIYFHGNGDLIDTRWNAVEPYLERGVSALAIEYRGYGRSGGEPSQSGIVADAVRFQDWLAARPEVDPNRILYHGLSIGGALAAATAAERKPAALVLECTLTNMSDIAHRWLLPGFLCRHPFRTSDVLPTLGIPVIIFHGRHDEVIPFEHGRRLHELTPGSVFVPRDCGHANWSGDWPAIEAFLRANRLLPASRGD